MSPVSHGRRWSSAAGWRCSPRSPRAAWTTDAIQAEVLGQTLAPGRCDEDSARPGQRPDPLELLQPVRERGAERAAEMVVLLAPVDAVADRRAAAREDRVDVDAERAEHVGATIGEAVVDVVAVCRRAVLASAPALVVAVAAAEDAALEQRAHEVDAEPPGEVVVARARRPHRLRAGAVLERAHRSGRRDRRQRLDRAADLRAGEAEVAMAPARLHGHEAAVDEPRE